MLKIVTVVGARPQFIKAAAVSRARAEGFADSLEEVLLHTGQHFDQNMSQVFFDELGIPEPAHNLEISGGSHGAMTGRMLEAIERVLEDEKPDWVLVYGDTNSTLAGALAAVKLHIPVAHVEAGLRSFNMRMPEEVNRILSDRISTLLFCPTELACRNLSAEGISKGVELVGDVMYDVALHAARLARERSTALHRLGVEPGRFVLATCHRAENTDDEGRLTQILEGLARIAREEPVILALHPRTRQIIDRGGLGTRLGRVTIVDPLPFFDMVALEQAARVIVTDSGGVQKEAFFYGVPCVTMRDETEWVETIELAANELVGASASHLIDAVHRARPVAKRSGSGPYGDGRAAHRIITSILKASRQE